MKMFYLTQKINIGGQDIQGPIEISGVPENQITLGVIVSRIVSLIIPIAAIILFIVLVWGGYDFMLSQGNPEKIKSAQGKITAGIIGFVLLILSYFIVRVLVYIFGLEGFI
ncbi:MAG: hypothetical protein QHH09_04590 [Microgenomates group bacterium]|nr:hypothetical protein [Microgenomates group bacterium]